LTTLMARLLAVCLLAALSGCSKPAPPGGEPPPPEVEASLPIVREVTDHEEFTGRIDAESSVDIRARVTGYLKEIYFKDGDMIKEGQVLFLIDPRPYHLDVAKNQAAVVQAQTRLERLDQDFNRARNMMAARAMAREEFDKTVGDRNEAKAQVESAKAALESSRLYLEWTQVRAPISGRVSRRLMDKGNMVMADQTTLTSIVSIDPVYVYFDVDERTLLRLRSEAPAAAPGKQPQARVEMGLSSEEGYPHEGVINFEDNRVDSNTGTIRMRGVFTNPKTTSGVRLLSPGLFARIRLPIGQPHRAVLVSDRALASDQGRKYLYVVTDKTDAETNRVHQTAERRYVQLGRLHGGLREIKESVDGVTLPDSEKVSAGDKVVVSGLQRIRPGIEVVPKEVPMPVKAPAKPTRRLAPRDKAPAVANKPAEAMVGRKR
jgi:RND family efflux transporter MFP subunit